MFSEYVETALARAEYKVIEGDEPYFALVPEPLGFEGPHSGGKHPYMVRGDPILSKILMVI